MSNKKLIFAGTIIVAVVVGYLAFRGANPGSQGTEGAIGAASRYQSEQVTNADISLDNPEVAAFLQSDTFRKLASNPAFREAARSESFNKFVSSDGLRKESAEGRAGRVLEDARVQELFKTDDFAKAMTTESLRESFRRADWAHLSEGNRLAELLKMDALRELSLKTDFHRIAEEARRMGDAFTMADFHRLAENSSLKGTEALRTLEGSKHFAEGFRALDFFRTAEDAKFAMDGLRRMSEGSSAFMDALRIDGFKQFMDAMNVSDFAAVRDLSGSPEMLSVLNDASFREAAARAEMGMVAHAGLEGAVARVEE